MTETAQILVAVIIIAIMITVIIKRRKKFDIGKKYKSNVGIKAVQEVFSAMHYYDADKAYVFTNSLYTKSARKLAQKLGVQLCDRNQIDALRKNVFNIGL